VEVEVENPPMKSNLLLGHNYFYRMMVVVSLVFRVLYFPHKRRIVTIYQLFYYTPNLRANIGTNVPLVGDSSSSYLSVGTRMYLLSTCSLFSCFFLSLGRTQSDQNRILQYPNSTHNSRYFLLGYPFTTS
jgi:hypothetical protein